MAKAIEKEYGRSVVGGFEVFEVGKEQLKELLGWYADIDEANKAFKRVFADRCAFGLVVDTMQHADGSYDEPSLVGWISSLDAALEVISTELVYAHHFGNNPIYEIWHVVEDGDLWQEWDIEAAAAGGDLQAAQQWEATFHDDKYLRQIEDQYTGDYHVYDTSVGEWPGVCIADVTQYDLSSGYKYVYEHWTAAGELLKQCVEDTVDASITCGWYRDGGWHVVDSDVNSIKEWEGLEVLRDDYAAPVWCPLRLCYVCWSED